MVRPEKASPTLLGGDGEDIIVILGPADLACERRQNIDRLSQEIQTAISSSSALARGDGAAVPSPFFWRARERGDARVREKGGATCGTGVPSRRWKATAESCTSC